MPEELILEFRESEGGRHLDGYEGAWVRDSEALQAC